MKNFQQCVLLCYIEGQTLLCKSFEEDTNETVDNMMTERFLLSNLDHPNIVKCDKERGTQYISFDGIPRW